MRSKGLNVKVPRLGLNRHGVYYVRSSALDATGSRKVTQRSLGTKDPLLAKALALRFCLSLISKELMSDWSKPLQRYEIDLDKGTLKADGPEDHAAMMEALRFLGPDAFLRQSLQRNQTAPAEQLPSGLDEFLRLAIAQRDSEALLQAPKPTKAGKKLRDALDDYLVEVSKLLKSSRTVLEKQRLFEEFSQFFGPDIDLNQISKEEISDRWRLAESNRLSQKVSKTQRARHAAKVALNPKLAGPITISVPRQEKRRGFLNLFFSWAIGMKYYMYENPMEHKVATKRELKQLNTKYRQYTGNDLKALFGSKYMTEMDKPDWFWVPLMALYSGARLNELASLTTDAFQEVDGIEVFDITDSKTEGGLRRVPVHSKLMELGLLKYVNFLRGEGERHLFWFRPQVTVSKSTGEMWGKWVERCGIHDPQKVFHSFRSTAITKMHNTTSPNPAAIRSAAGHTGGLTGSHGDYVQESDLLQVQIAIESLIFPSVDVTQLRLDDATFSEFYYRQKKRLTSPGYARQQERRKKLAASIAMFEAGRAGSSQERT